MKKFLMGVAVTVTIQKVVRSESVKRYTQKKVARVIDGLVSVVISEMEKRHRDANVSQLRGKRA